MKYYLIYLNIEIKLAAEISGVILFAKCELLLDISSISVLDKFIKFNILFVKSNVELLLKTKPL